MIGLVFVSSILLNSSGRECGKSFILLIGLMAYSLVTAARESFRDEKAPASHISIRLKPSAITSHPIISGRDQSTSAAPFTNRPNVKVMFNIYLPMFR
jgi:hypothetical protein